MVNTTLFLVVLFLVSAGAASRTKLYSISDQEGANDGICKSMVETQGYICHEHTVSCILDLLFNILFNLFKYK